MYFSLHDVLASSFEFCELGLMCCRMGCIISIIVQFLFLVRKLYFCVLDLGIYVDSNGMRSRKLELMWPAPPLAVCE